LDKSTYGAALVPATGAKQAKDHWQLWIADNSIIRVQNFFTNNWQPE
jgi:hypothetical protein